MFAAAVNYILNVNTLYKKEHYIKILQVEQDAIRIVFTYILSLFTNILYYTLSLIFKIKLG